MTIVTISGLPGSGTTTVAKLLEKKTGITYVYSGDIFRRMAKKHNMSLEDFGIYCEKHKEVDLMYKFEGGLEINPWRPSGFEKFGTFSFYGDKYESKSDEAQKIIIDKQINRCII